MGYFERAQPARARIQHVEAGGIGKPQGGLKHAGGGGLHEPATHTDKNQQVDIRRRLAGCIQRRTRRGHREVDGTLTIGAVETLPCTRGLKEVGESLRDRFALITGKMWIALQDAFNKRLIGHYHAGNRMFDGSYLHW